MHIALFVFKKKENTYSSNMVQFIFAEERLYWCEAYHDFIESVLLDGSDRIQHVYTSASVNINPFSIAVRGSDDDIYVTDTNYKNIIVLDRSEGEFEFVGSFQAPTGLVINQGEDYGPIHFIKSEEKKVASKSRTLRLPSYF